MSNSSMLGLIFADNNESVSLPSLCEGRTLGAVPFGGKYRLIDFPLSNMANSGIDKIGVIIKNNYHSLLDHLGSGKAWGLSRRKGGLILLPPFLKSAGFYDGKVQILSSLSSFIEKSSEKYVLISECGEVCNFNYRLMLEQHIKTGADITISYKQSENYKNINQPLFLELDENQRIVDMFIGDKMTSGRQNLSLFSMLIEKNLLLKLVAACAGRNKLDFKRDILQSNINNLKIFGYKFDGIDMIIGSLDEYFNSNMALMESDVRTKLFDKRHPIITKARDDMPAKYGLRSNITNSLIAAGSVIEGSVSNCVIFSGVKIGKGSRLSHCIIMQDTIIGENVDLSYVICDKDSQITFGKSINSQLFCPVYIKKRSVV